MKKTFLQILLLASISAYAQEKIILGTAKFKTGDNIQWKDA